MKRMNGELSEEVAALILNRSLSPSGQTSLTDRDESNEREGAEKGENET